MLFRSAPAQTPATITMRLNTEINNILRDAEAARALASEGAEVTAWTPAQFGAKLLSEIEKWGKLIRDSGIRE